MNTYLFCDDYVGATRSTPRSASKAASKFGTEDIDSIISPRAIKKELTKSQTETRAPSARGKAGTKRKKPSEPEDEVMQLERKLHESVAEVRIPEASNQFTIFAEDPRSLYFCLT
jgi:hypothetical protein